MTEREFGQRLRAFYRAEAESAGRAPETLRDRVWAIPDEMPHTRGFFGTRRGIVLAAAAMLAVLLIGGAVAVGAGLIKLPWLPDNKDSTIISNVSDEQLGFQACNQELADGLVLSVVSSDGESAPRQVLVYDTGLVLRGPQFDDPAGGVPWEQRHISTEGMHLLLAAIEASGLGKCWDVPVPGPQLEVRARTSGGTTMIHLGSGSFRVFTEQELAAGASLAARLGDPDISVLPADWTDAAWQPYSLDRFDVRILRWEGFQEAYAGAPVFAWADIVLPDGSTPMTYGRPVPVDPDSIFVEGRCQTVDLAAADEMKAFLDDVTPDPGIWSFRDARGGVTFGVSARLPHEAGCPSYLDRPQPLPREDLIEDLQVCDYLPEQLIAEVLGEEWRQLAAMDRYGDGGWAACEYWPGGWVFASRHRMSSEEALAAVEAQFGARFTTDEIAGRTVYFNDCLDPEDECRPAIAVSADPHLVIIIADDGGESVLRLLAEALIVDSSAE